MDTKDSSGYSGFSTVVHRILLFSSILIIVPLSADLPRISPSYPEAWGQLACFNGVCDTVFEDSCNCPADCSNTFNCGNGCCDYEAENTDNCPGDCFCGNGTTEGTEECDDGNDFDTDLCSNTCKNGFCGDGIVQCVLPEPANLDLPGDSFFARLILGTAYAVHETSESMPYCEECDDGNNIDDDGCSADCHIEGGSCTDISSCPTDGSDDSYCINTSFIEGASCAPFGVCFRFAASAPDGSCAPEETCTDMTAAFCTDYCCTTAPGPAVCVPAYLEFCPAGAVCGNGTVETGEECDDGNDDNTDLCTNECKHAVCGDGIFVPCAPLPELPSLDLPGDSFFARLIYGSAYAQPAPDYCEECDDGNNIDGDGCSDDCHIEIENPCGNGFCGDDGEDACTCPQDCNGSCGGTLKAVECCFNSVVGDCASQCADGASCGGGGVACCHSLYNILCEPAENCEACASETTFDGMVKSCYTYDPGVGGICSSCSLEVAPETDPCSRCGDFASSCNPAPTDLVACCQDGAATCSLLPTCDNCPAESDGATFSCVTDLATLTYCQGDCFEDPLCQFCGDGGVCGDGQCCFPNNINLFANCEACTAIGGACSPFFELACDDGNPCTDDGECDCATGECPPPTPNTDPCDDGDPCTTEDICLEGICAGTSVPACACTSAEDCNDGDPCTVDTCDDGTGTCLPSSPVICDDLNACTDDGACDSLTGECPTPTPVVCDDGDACTTNDTCSGETGENCLGTPVVCPDPDQCHEAGVCDSGTGSCSNPAKEDGTTCDDGDPCTQTDSCNAGICTGSNPVVCPDAPCQRDGACEGGSCVYQTVDPNGTSCDTDGNLCTIESCQLTGVCRFDFDVTCPPPPQCHKPGTCVPETGECAYAPTTSPFARCDANGDSCEDDCEEGTGICVATSPCCGDAVCEVTERFGARLCCNDCGTQQACDPTSEDGGQSECDAFFAGRGEPLGHCEKEGRRGCVSDDDCLPFRGRCLPNFGCSEEGICRHRSEYLEAFNCTPFGSFTCGTVESGGSCWPNTDNQTCEPGLSCEFLFTDFTQQPPVTVSACDHFDCGMLNPGREFDGEYNCPDEVFCGSGDFCVARPAGNGTDPDTGVCTFCGDCACQTGNDGRPPEDGSSCPVDCDTANFCDDGNACTVESCDNSCFEGSTDPECDTARPGCRHTPVPAATVCRASGGECDLAEACDGTSAPCPADAKRDDECRAQAGDCDLADFCDGVNNDCPADAKSTDVCRPAVDDQCDIEESCDGVIDDCPADLFEPDGTACDNDGEACTDDRCSSADCVTGAAPTCSTATSADQVACICPCSFLAPGKKVSGAKNHGHYVSCVACVTNNMVARGVITGQEKGVIQSTAGQSSCVMTKADKQAVCQGNNCNTPPPPPLP